MSCPSCNSEHTYVVLTKTTPENDIVRRRCCRSCQYRWYTVQPPEEWLDPTTVFWRSKELLIYPPRSRREPIKGFLRDPHLTARLISLITTP